MKRILLAALLLCASLSQAQLGQTTQIRHGTSMPASCSPSNGDTFFRISGGSGAGLYDCPSSNTWRLIATAAAGLSDPGSNGIVKRTATNTTGIAAASDITALWTGTADAAHLMTGGGTLKELSYVVPVQYEAAPTASQTARHVIPGGVGTVSIATNCPNCTFSIGTSATATTTFSIKKNGSQFGTVAVTSGGSVTWTVTATTLTSGDILSVVAPASPDATAAQIAMSIYATR